jgi:hypothetical protein
MYTYPLKLLLLNYQYALKLSIAMSKLDKQFQSV